MSEIFNFDSQYYIEALTGSFSFDSNYQITETKSFGFESSYQVNVPNEFGFSSTYEVRPKGEQVFNFDSRYLIKESGNIQPPQDLELYINGELFDYAPEVEKLTVSSNSSSHGYALSLTSNKIPEGLNLNTPIELIVNGEIYRFIFDRVELSKQGVGEFTRVLSAVAPIMKHTTPRSSTVSYTNDAPILARDLVETILGVSVNWNIIDWLIPEFRLAAENLTPLDIVGQVVKAVGANIRSAKDGTLTVNYDFKVSPTEYDTATKKLELNTFEHVFTLKAALVPKGGFNRFVVTDTNTTTISAEITESSVISRNSAVIKVFTPRVMDLQLIATANEPLLYETTSKNKLVSVTELVEFKAGRGEVGKPVQGIESVEFISKAVTGIGYTQGGTVITAGTSESYALANVTYKTLLTSFFVDGVTSSRVQFLINEVV
ncbi:hypothetical protein [Vibrio phage 29Fa.3]|nr:hypothetical protein [Vibrio phage 29Fa.3]WKC56053.1 hypothetical protein [Vibrio phage CAU_VPP01]